MRHYARPHTPTPAATVCGGHLMHQAACIDPAPMPEDVAHVFHTGITVTSAANHSICLTPTSRHHLHPRSRYFPAIFTAAIRFRSPCYSRGLSSARLSSVVSTAATLIVETVFCFDSCVLEKDGGGGAAAGVAAPPSVFPFSVSA